MQGWKTEAMMRRYATVDLNNQRDALTALDEFGKISESRRTGNA
jgi:hypothetical protein